MFEEWMQAFVDTIGMSAGFVVFDDYFGELMVSSIKRISEVDKSSSTVPCNYTKDFAKLFQNVCTTRLEAHSVHAATGMTFTPENFVRLHQLNMHQRARIEFATKVSQVREQNLNELVQIVSQLANVGSINRDQAIHMMHLLDLKEPSDYA